MNKVIECKIISNKPLTADIYELIVQGPTSWYHPGMFVNIAIPGLTLRRPMSVCAVNRNSFTIIYRVVGKGTEILKQMLPGQLLNILIELGNFYTYQKINGEPVIVAAGCGLGSVLGLAQWFKKKNIHFNMVVGFRNKKDVIYASKLKTLCPSVHICTDDGSFGEKGLITDILIKHGLQKKYYYACGSNAMLQALYHASGTEGQLSLESRMGCGFGACMGCSIKTKNGYKQVCKDGPVFESKELLW